MRVLSVRHLGMISQAQQSAAGGISRRGWIVGVSIAPRKQHGAQLGFLVRPSIGMIPLSLLVSGRSRWSILDAAGINNAGQIAADGYRVKGARHGPEEALLLTPVRKTRHRPRPPGRK